MDVRTFFDNCAWRRIVLKIHSYMKKTVKKSIHKEPNIQEDIRQLGVMVEANNDKINLVIEGHRGLEKKIDANQKEFREFEKGTNYKFDVMLQEFIDFRKETGYKFETVLDELHLIRNELKEKISRDEFLLLEKRVAHLEKTRK